MSDSEELYYPRKGKDPVRPEAPPLRTFLVPLLSTGTHASVARLKGQDLPDVEGEAPEWNGPPSLGESTLGMFNVAGQMNHKVAEYIVGLDQPAQALPGWVIAQPTSGERFGLLFECTGLRLPTPQLLTYVFDRIFNSRTCSTVRRPRGLTSRLAEIVVWLTQALHVSDFLSRSCAFESASRF